MQTERMSGEITRRRFLSGATASVLGASLLPAETHKAAKTKSVIHLFMAGGMSHIDTFDPKPGVRKILTNMDGIHISEHLPLLARRMDRITLIRSMSHEHRNHKTARDSFQFTEEIIIDGWDTHTDIQTRIALQCAILDRTLSGLLDDLEAQGTLAATLVVVTTEFGRSAKLNAFGGREHHPAAFTCLLAGGGLRGGQVIGETSGDGMQVMGETTSPADLHAMIEAWKGRSESALS